MTLDPKAFAAAAMALVGTPFRLHGRDPGTGLDCVGVLVAALKSCGYSPDLPVGYRLRMASIDGWLPAASDCGFSQVEGDPIAGDVVLLQVGPVQYHLAISLGPAGWAHAHAGLRRVIQSPALPDGTTIEHWRPAPST